MRVSVVIPTLNEAFTIREALCRLHRLSPYEVIVGDGGSEDATCELAGPYATVVSGPRGRGLQLNAAASHASGDVLLFLHADVRLPADALSAIESSLGEPGVVGGYFRVRFGCGRHEVILAAFYDLLRRGGIVYGDAAIFVRREAFLRLGGYRDYAIMEDLNLVRRLRRLGRVVEVPREVLASPRRWRGGGLWHTWVSWVAVQSLYGLGASPQWLGRIYRAVR